MGCHATGLPRRLHVDLGEAGSSSELAKVGRDQRDYEAEVSVFLVLHFWFQAFPWHRKKKAHVHQKDVEIVYVPLLAWRQGERLGDLGSVGTLFIESRSSGFCIFDVGM